MEKKEIKYLLNLCNSILLKVKNIDLINITEEEKISLNERLRKINIIDPSSDYTIEFNSQIIFIKECLKELSRYNILEFIGIIKGIKQVLILL